MHCRCMISGCFSTFAEKQQESEVSASAMVMPPGDENGEMAVIGAVPDDHVLADVEPKIVIHPVAAEPDRGEIRLHDAAERAEGGAVEAPFLHLLGRVFAAV